MNLQESIRRVLREEDYSPAGKEITPNSIIVHKSNPIFRDKIMEEGLKVRAGECYKIFVGYGVKCKPAIFATNSTNKRAWFDSTYDDDIWFIDTRIIPDVKWYKDRHFESTKKHIVTFQDIPKEAITLYYEGTGSGDVKKWDKDSPNLYESIRRILMEEKKKERTHYHQYKLGDVIDGSKLDDLSGGLVGNDNNQYVLVQYPLYKFPYTRQDLIDSDPEYAEEEIWRLESIKDNFDKTPPIPQEGDGLHRIIAAKELGYKTILMWKKIMNIQESIRRVLREEITEDKNLYGEKLKMCSKNPMTGFYRDGYCRTGDDDTGSHTVCAKVTEEFLEFTNSMGNNLDMLEPGDKWCLCAMRWKEAKDNGINLKVDKSATNIKTLDILNSSYEIIESEITERCWKGYTQKGMKTMFGKRYPNCVKIKKKK